MSGGLEELLNVARFKFGFCFVPNRKKSFVRFVDESIERVDVEMQKLARINDVDHLEHVSPFAVKHLGIKRIQ